jgi:hypothetical protein
LEPKTSSDLRLFFWHVECVEDKDDAPMVKLNNLMNVFFYVLNVTFNFRSFGSMEVGKIVDMFQRVYANV